MNKKVVLLQQFLSNIKIIRSKSLLIFTLNLKLLLNNFFAQYYYFTQL
jgi:hypothetical protein